MWLQVKLCTGTFERLPQWPTHLRCVVAAALPEHVGALLPRCAGGSVCCGLCRSRGSGHSAQVRRCLKYFQVPEAKASGIAYDRRGYTRLAELYLKG